MSEALNIGGITAKPSLNIGPIKNPFIISSHSTYSNILANYTLQQYQNNLLKPKLLTTLSV